jgi:4-hydroxybenzoate polyprenyltransferase
MLLGYIIKSMRPRQWVKNLVVFGALMFVPGAVKSGACWAYAVGAFAAFCFISGAIYLINDVADRHRDVMHPRKKKRPIASGKLSAAAAVISAIIALIIGLAICFGIDTVASKPQFPETYPEPYGLTITAASYVILMLLYSYLIKREIILDVLALSIGFVLRAAAGGFALDVRISPWLLATTLFVSLFLALGKRRAEIVELERDAESHRDVLAKYSVRLIDALLIVCAAANIMSYSLYTFLHDLGTNAAINIAGNNPANTQIQGDIHLMFTVPFVIYGIFRYLHLLFKHDMGASPDEVLTRDGRIILCIILWAITVLFVLSLK